MRPSERVPGQDHPRLTPRLFAALVGGKLAGHASRVAGRGGGTAISGLVAARLQPGILGLLLERPGVPVVAITGSNGKTTPRAEVRAGVRARAARRCDRAAGACRRAREGDAKPWTKDGSRSRSLRPRVGLVTS